MRLRHLALGVIAAYALTSGAYIERVSAAPIIFDFESQALSSSVSSLSLTKDGLTVTITQPGANFRIRDASSIVLGGVPEFGSRSLLGGGISFRPFLVNFSTPVQSVSIDGGDISGLAGDEFDNPFLEAFDALNGGGNSLGTDQVLNCCGGGTGFEFVTVDVTAAGIQSIEFIGGAISLPVSLFFDNLCADPTGNGCPATGSTGIPEPGTTTLFCLGMLGLGYLRRRRQR